MNIKLNSRDISLSDCDSSEINNKVKLNVK